MFLFAAQLFRECEPARRAQRDVEDAGGAWQVDTRRPNDVLAATFDALVVDPFSIPFGMQCERKERSYGTRRRGSRTPLAPESMLGHVWCQPHLEKISAYFGKATHPSAPTHFWIISCSAVVKCFPMAA
jgi:hypothetical protein